MPLIESIVADAPALVAVRRDIHAHPELCFEEVRTADLVAQQLAAWGIEVHRGFAKTGVVGVIRNGTSGRTVGLRADMDALPMQEHNTFAHASRHPGRMHACGHDGHTAMLLAAAQYLARHRDFDGTVYLVFQPAEEGGGGAREMIDDGLFASFPMEAIFAMHNWPGIPVGQLAVCAGPAMASSNEFRIVVRGKGAHAAMPHLGLDPVPVACQLVQAFQTVVTRNKKPLDTAVISVTMIHTGEATNVVPEVCEIQGTVRTFTLEVLDLVERRMRELTDHICRAFGTEGEFTFRRNYPPTVNHAREAAFVKEVLSEVVGADNALTFEPTMAAEDFSYFLQARPGAYFVIGNGDGAHRGVHDAVAASHPGTTAAASPGPCTLHNPHYDFNDALIPLGATVWVRLVQRWLAVPR